MATEIDRLRDDALAVVQDTECSALLAATAHGEDAARRAYVRAKVLDAPPHLALTRRGRETWLTALVARRALGYADAAVCAREIIASLAAEAV